ncbi:MAG: class I SAM-dependent methyltransferase [Parasphingopyxis sp.]|uniref:class I SAM-dependent methyltransferase n=1 Tax=Parasphingopyxis sp. TaxID=1920299 RepID=UPI003FA04501
MSGGEDPATLAFYQAEWRDVCAAHRRFRTSLKLGDFLARLPRGARILELGCGGGRDTKEVIAAGFDVDATDGCAEIAADTAAYLGHPVRAMRFEELSAMAAYDGIWAEACLLHVRRSHLPNVLGNVHRALRPGGLFQASYKAGEAEGYDELGRYFNFPDRQWLIGAYESTARWASIDLATGPGLQSCGPAIDWHRVMAVK